MNALLLVISMEESMCKKKKGRNLEQCLSREPDSTVRRERGILEMKAEGLRGGREKIGLITPTPTGALCSCFHAKL